MKKVLRKKTARGIRFLIAAFVLTACFWNVSVAQIPKNPPTVTQSIPGCFHIDDAVGAITKQDPPCSGPCTTNGSNCNNCWNFTIYACNNTLHPDSFKITATGFQGGSACFSVCSPTGDFIDPDGRTNCDPNAKFPGLVLGHAPITSTQGASFTICAPPGATIHIELDHHSGQSPCQWPCDPVDIHF